VEPIIWLEDVHAADVACVGPKAAALGRLLHDGFPVPTGFVLTGDGYRAGSEHADVDIELREELATAYRELGNRLGHHDPAVAVRSSVTAHDACYVGIRPAVIDVRGAGALVEAVSRVWMSLFDERAVIARAAFGFTDAPATAVIVQTMAPVVRSGSAYSVDPVRRRDDIVRVEAVFGRGEGVPTGPPASDSYLVCRGTDEVVETRIGAKTVEVVGHGDDVVTVPLPATRRHPRVLSDHDAARIAELAVAVEGLMGGPQDIDWCLGPTGLIEVLRTSPISLEPTISRALAS
jgi:pyruvate,water dikinase